MIGIKDSVKLMLDCSRDDPYSGKLSFINNHIAAIQLAELCKQFAEKGLTDEAMNLDSDHWEEVINTLKGLKRKIRIGKILQKWK